MPVPREQLQAARDTAKNLLLLVDSRGMKDGSAYGDIGLLFECARDSPTLSVMWQPLLRDELLGDVTAIKDEAAALARRLLQDEPLLRGVRQLSVFEELLIRELQQQLHARHLHSVLQQHGFTSCRFNSAHPLAATLRWWSRYLDSGLQVQAPAVADPLFAASSLLRSWQRLRAARFSRQALGQELEQVWGRVDPWQRRKRLHAKTAGEKGGLWFYTTAFTFTRIGLLYEPWLPQPLQFLVDSPWTGGLPLTAAGRAFSDPAGFGQKNMEPSGAEVAAAQQLIRAHLQGVPLSSQDAGLRDAVLASAMLDGFLQRLLPQGLFHTSLFRRVMALLQPAAVLVGNPVFEAYALLAAREAGIPTLLLQHGILGDFCQYVDPPVDHYIVRGSFWRDFLSAAARARARVLNPPESVQTGPELQRKTPQLLFLTTPYSLQTLWDESDLEDILRVLVATCRDHSATLVVRVHPLEAPGSYRRLVDTLLAGMLPAGNAAPRIQFSQGDSLDPILAASSVAVTYASTAFLDCLRHRVPVVSFDWHDFSYKQQIRALNVFHFASSLSSLGALVARGLQGDLPPFADDCTPFLQPDSAAALQAELARLTCAEVRE